MGITGAICVVVSSLRPTCIRNLHSIEAFHYCSSLDCELIACAIIAWLKLNYVFINWCWLWVYLCGESLVSSGGGVQV